MYFTPEKYINAILERYVVSDKDMDKLRAGADLLQKTFGDYYWSDIETAIGWYYTHKNDKTRPTIAQMQAVLQGLDITPSAKQDYADAGYKRPTTKIWSIMHTFNRLVEILIDGGVLPQDNGEYHNIRTLVNPQTDLVILNPKQWLQWQLDDAMAARPDLFAKFPHCTWLERLAIAIENKLIVFKVRDWAKLAKGGK